jgi:hypothetical protein
VSVAVAAGLPWAHADPSRCAWNSLSPLFGT